MKKFLVYSLFIFLSASLAGAQCVVNCTSVTATLTDSAGQIWTFATVTINIVKPFGNPGQILNNGVPIGSSTYTVTTDLTGTFTISLDDNNVLTPKGTTWSFTLCPNATVQNCSQSTQFITGASLNLTTILSTAITPVIVNTAPTIFRAYNDLEALGGQGSVYWRTSDNTLRGCFGAPCPSSWIPIGSGGGGGGSGTVNNGNLNLIPKYVTNPNGTVLGPDANLDDGATLANALTYKGSTGLNLPTDGVHAGSVQIGGNTTLPTTFSTNAIGWIGPNSNSFTSWFLQPSSTGPSNATPFMSCSTPVSNVSTCTFVAATGSNGLPANPQIGDTIRFNIDGSGLWVATNTASPSIGVYPVWGGQPQSFGIFGNISVTCSGNNSSDVNPTLTLGSGRLCGQTGAVGSTSTVIGLSFGANGNNSRIGMQAFYRWSARISFNLLTNARYWMGLSSFNSSGTGNNTATIVGSTAYATNTPNKSTEGFRCSAGTDTNWQAVAIIATGGGGTQTTVNTSVACDTNIHLFEMTPNAAGTSILYWIDGTNVATISTNLPPPANGANSWGDIFFTGDNENTTTAISATLYSMQISLKQ